MSQVKKVFFTLSCDEFKQLEEKAERSHQSVEEFTGNVIKKYLKSDKELGLEKGYQEMAQINLELAQMCFDADEEICRQYEEKITECE